MPRPEFRTLFCERFQCASTEYEERAFRKCLYWHARFLAPLIRKLNPGFFADDFKFIQYLGMATRSRDVNVEMLEFQDTNRAKWSFWRIGLRIRVSGRKASALAKQLLSHESSGSGGS